MCCAMRAFDGVDEVPFICVSLVSRRLILHCQCVTYLSVGGGVSLGRVPVRGGLGAAVLTCCVVGY